MTKTAKLSEHDLRQFTGTDQWYRHGINRDVLFTAASHAQRAVDFLHGLQPRVATALTLPSGLLGCADVAYDFQ